MAPTLYRWRVRSRIYRWYGALMAIERAMSQPHTPEEGTKILARIDQIAHSVDEIKTPLSFADQLYVLRDHVAAVRRRMQQSARSGRPPEPDLIARPATF